MYLRNRRVGAAEALAEITAHLDAGGDPRVDHNAPLHLACEYGLLDLVERLLTAGLMLEDVRVFNTYALRAACEYGHLAIVNRLLAFGLGLADARANDSAALHWACRRGHLAVVERLIELGMTADDVRASDGIVLVDAYGNGHIAVANRLIELGLTKDEVVACGSRAMQKVGLYGIHPVVAHLLTQGVAPTGDALRSIGGIHGGIHGGSPSDSLWRAIEPWLDSPELASAESTLSLAEAATWAEAKERAYDARPWALRFAD